MDHHFSSSVAVYGGEVPDPIEDHTFLNPQTSYGTQKAIGELLLNDYSRKDILMVAVSAAHHIGASR